MARLAGVSTSTVSYALSGERPISAATRERIEAAMAELGYTPNALAGGLAGRRSRILALLFPAAARGIGSDDLEYVVAAADAARELGYHLVLSPTASTDLDEIRRLWRTGLVDGVLLMEVLLRDERVEALQEMGTPLSLIGRTADPTGVPFADADFDQMGTLAVEHLLGLGHRSLGVLTVPQRWTDRAFAPTHRLTDAIERSARAAGAQISFFPCEHSVAAGRALFRELRPDRDGITGLIAVNWFAAVGVGQEAHVAGVQVPGELSIVSVASSDQHADLTEPALTTICPPAAEIGRAAARALIERLDRESSVQQVLFPGRLTVRGTSAAPR